MINVKFNSEVNGVMECNCHHVTFLGWPRARKFILHFTENISWEIDDFLIKQIG